MRQLPLLLTSVALAIACGPAPPAAEEAEAHTHADLLHLFEEVRVFQEPEIQDGVPDYTAEAMERQRQGLEGYKARLAAIEIGDWPVSEQIDVEFLRDDEVLTVPDWMDPTDYSDPNEPPEPLPSDPSIDHKAREREILPGESHEYVGHMFDGQRRPRDERPVRGADRRFNMEWMRMEGWAVALEELLMQAGVLDERPRRGREVEYLMNISHMSLALPDLAMHANLITFDESRKLCAALMAKGWSQEDERMVWYEMESNLRFPGFHTGIVVGKAHFMKLFRERALQLGDDFVLRDFIDEFLAGGIIPISLIRWEMTGYDDEIRFLTGEDGVPNRLFDPALQLADRL